MPFHDKVAGVSAAGGTASRPPCKLPSIPAADKIDQRTASIPSARPGPIFASALQVKISPKDPGPSEARGSGWTMGLIPWSRSCNRSMLAGVTPVFICFNCLTRNLSTLDRMIWCGIAWCRNSLRISASVCLMPCVLSMRRNARRSL